MIKPIRLTNEQLLLLKQTVAIVYPNAKITIKRNLIIKVRIDNCYNINNLDVHWIEFIYRIYMPILPTIPSIWFDAKRAKDFSLYEQNTIDYLFIYLEKWNKYILEHRSK